MLQNDPPKSPLKRGTLNLLDPDGEAVAGAEGDRGMASLAFRIAAGGDRETSCRVVLLINCDRPSLVILLQLVPDH
jgi:hypothetical protein